MDFTSILKNLSSFFKTSYTQKKSQQALTVMILSPHPDDESIVGSLALRLRRENNCHIINVAVTTGSKVERRSERIKELTNACRLLDMECVFLSEKWTTKEKELKTLLTKVRPSVIIAPHSRDFHPTHIKTGELCQKVLAKMTKSSLLVAWSEFWGPMKNPNLLVEVPVDILELQMKALELHKGEVARNPYHLRLPAWMMDSVRRGSEVIGGKGAEATQMAFGVLYRLQLVKSGKFLNLKLQTPFLEAEQDIGQMFKLILDEASGSKTKVK
jgi:LmbE family N-acetylglucosaminyl deacetylase